MGTDHERTSLWAGLAVGMSTVCVLGLFGVMIYLLTRRQEAASGGVAGVLEPGPNPPTASMIDSMPVVRMPNLPPSTSAARGASYATTMNTYRLAQDNASKIFQAVGTRHWRATVRVVGPPGTFAFIGTDPSSVLSDSGWNVNIVPAGDETPIRLRPRDKLYARGNVSGVLVSFSAYEDDD